MHETYILNSTKIPDLFFPPPVQLGLDYAWITTGVVDTVSDNISDTLTEATSNPSQKV